MGRSNHSIAKTLALIGALVAIVGYILTMAASIGGNNVVVNIIVGLVGIILSIMILSSIGSVRTKTNIPFEWWMLLIFVIVQALMLVYMVNIYSITGLGIVLELIAVIFLLLEKM